VPQQYTLLIVDDETSIRSLLAEFLSDSYTILTAENGEQGWQIIEENQGKIDIVLSDIDMPLLNGVELLQRVRDKYQDICFIMMSGTADVHTAIKAIRHGAYDYISKPIGDLDEIHILVQRWANQQSLEAKLAMYAELHQEILHNLKVRTFLGVDVIGSKKIKSGESPLLIHYSFLAYNRLIESIVLKNGGQVHSTAGDGVMSCFILPQAAINSAKQIIAGLGAFNKNQNRLEQDFALRLGIHTGTVMVEESGRVNEMYSESLDLTGHIQKDAGFNQTEVSESVLENLENRSEFTALDKEIGGYPVYLLNS
jgi:CheY-like chemotaxis protein